MSCILTLPPYQRQGYGRLLIDFSEYTTPRLLFFFSSFLSLSPASGSSNRSALARARRPVDDDIRPNEIERMVELGTGVCRNASVVSVAWPLVDVAVAAIERPCPARATGTNSTRSSLASLSSSRFSVIKEPQPPRLMPRHCLQTTIASILLLKNAYSTILQHRVVNDTDLERRKGSRDRFFSFV